MKSVIFFAPPEMGIIFVPTGKGVHYIFFIPTGREFRPSEAPPYHLVMVSTYTVNSSPYAYLELIGEPISLSKN